MMFFCHRHIRRIKRERHREWMNMARSSTIIIFIIIIIFLFGSSSQGRILNFEQHPLSSPWRLTLVSSTGVWEWTLSLFTRDVFVSAGRVLSCFCSNWSTPSKTGDSLNIQRFHFKAVFYYSLFRQTFLSGNSEKCPSELLRGEDI